jgi:hypothetical protein
MIRLERGRAPAILTGHIADKALSDARKFFEEDTQAARQRRFDFDRGGLLEHRSVHDALGAISEERCAFCNVGTDGDAVLASHRFRPPQDAVAKDGSTSRRHYWWLAYDWQNLYPACEGCRIAQGAKFPTGADRVRVGTTGNLLDREEPLLLDPCRDDPELFLVYLDTGEVVSREPRGKATVETFDLNRPQLVRERQAAAQLAMTEVREIGRLLYQERLGDVADALPYLYSSSSPFAAVRRQFVNQWVQFRWRKVDEALASASEGELRLFDLVGSLRRITDRAMREAADDFFELEGKPLTPVAVIPRAEARPVRRREAPAPEEILPYLTAAEIRRVEIRDFRAIESLDLEVARGPGEGSWLMLLGENGAGKTSVLQAIALTLCDPMTRDRLGVDGRTLLGPGADEGRVRVELTGSRRARELSFNRGSRDLEVFGPEEGTLMAGYGATRLLLSKGTRKRAYTSVENLFDPRSQGMNPRPWLKKISPGEFDAVAGALRVLLQLGEEEDVVRSRGGGIAIDGGGEPRELNELSDGYKAMAMLALDLMQLFLMRWGTVEAAEGIVLLDELGAHLHPRWQMRVTESLRATFPRVQFIATTHDPLCLRGLNDGEVVVLHRRDGHIFAIHDELPPIKGMTVDQLLTNEHFGLNSSLEPAVEELFTRYYDLLSRRDHSPREKEELAEMRDRLEGMRLLGQTRRERLALEAVDESLAAERHVQSGPDLAHLNESAKAQIRAIWDEVAGG